MTSTTSTTRMSGYRRALLVLVLAGCGGATSPAVPELEAATTAGADEVDTTETGETGETAAGQTQADPLAPPPPAETEVTRFDTSDVPSRGPADAAVVVDVFSDFECPFCSLARRHSARLLEDFPFVRVRYRHFPLPSHQHAGMAAEASVEAYAQGGNDAFWCFHDQVFDHQDSLSQARLLSLATRCDLDARAMQQALRDHRHAERVRQDRTAGDALGVQGTPSFVVNDNLVGGAYTDVEEAVELAHPGS